MKFTQIVESLKYPSRKRGILSSEHSSIINYAMKQDLRTQRNKKNIINILNSVTYAVMHKEYYKLDFESENPFSELTIKPDNDLKSDLGELYIDIHNVEWDISDKGASVPKASVVKSVVAPTTVINTPKEDLYLRAPQYPRYDTSKYWLSEAIGSEHFYMHPSLPIIPEKQGDVSCTTDVNKMTEKELLKLYPNHLIRTRAAVMYEPCGDIPLDKDLGLLIPIDGYTTKQVRENIIKYPHFFQLTRVLNDQEISFYKHIELNGEIKDTLEVWDSLPVSKVLPKTSEFIKEYIIRKYLLDRDNGVDHKFPLKGTLEPFLTLFAPVEFYKDYGDPAELMRTCVKARVSFFQSRNPYLARYLRIKQGIGFITDTITCPFKAYCRKSNCDTVCPDYVEIQYLLERNLLENNKAIYAATAKDFQNCSEWLTVASDDLRVVTSDNTTDTASRLTYTAICQHWKGNTLHCSVYLLNFANYIDMEKASYSTYTPNEAFEYMKIFIQSAKVLIISNIDYMQFNEFNARILLAILSNRKFNHQTTIVVSPKLNKLMGTGPLFSALKDMFMKGEIN